MPTKITYRRPSPDDAKRAVDPDSLAAVLDRLRAAHELGDEGACRAAAELACRAYRSESQEHLTELTHTQRQYLFWTLEERAEGAEERHAPFTKGKAPDRVPWHAVVRTLADADIARTEDEVVEALVRLTADNHPVFEDYITRDRTACILDSRPCPPTGDHFHVRNRNGHLVPLAVTRVKKIIHRHRASTTPPS